MLAERGRDGCESLLKEEEKEKDDVVGSVKGKGMFFYCWFVKQQARSE